MSYKLMGQKGTKYFYGFNPGYGVVHSGCAVTIAGKNPLAPSEMIRSDISTFEKLQRIPEKFTRAMLPLVRVIYLT